MRKLFHVLQSWFVGTGKRSISFEEFEKAGNGLLSALAECNPDLSCNEESIEWLNDYFDKTRSFHTPEYRNGVAIGLGYVLGQAIVQGCGGNWKYCEENRMWVVKLNPSNVTLLPVAKSYRHLSEEYEGISTLLGFAKQVAENGGVDGVVSRAKST